jgi:MFS family permease
MMALPAFATHACIGSPWAWSALSEALTREHGFIVSSASDWTMTQCTLPISIVFAFQGIVASLSGKWQMRVGPRAAMLAASACFGGGIALGALGVHLHQLWLLYAGYGIMGGTGIGLAYTPPMQALMQWYPDRKGFASGITIAGFGSGALLFSPAVQALMERFQRMPQRLGSVEDVTLVAGGDGKLYAALEAVAGRGAAVLNTAPSSGWAGCEAAASASGVSLREVVVATAAEASAHHAAMAEGVYVVGTGSTGAAPALACVGAGYFAVMAASAFAIRTPSSAVGGRPSPAGRPLVPDGSQATDPAARDPAARETLPTPAANEPDGATDPATARDLAARSVTVDAAMRTPQFWLLWTYFASVATGGVALFSVAKPMMTDVFSSAMPGVVTASFASAYLMGMAGANLGGRLGWASFSDRFGRPRTFALFAFGSAPLYLALPALIRAAVESPEPSAAPLVAFCGATFAAVSFMGGTYAALPAYEADLFGPKYVGAIHGRMLLASSAASLAGPSLLLALRARAETDAMADLLARVDPAVFAERFGADISQAKQLADAKTLTVQKLLEVLPGAVDPTPFLYDSTMYAMTGSMCVAAAASTLVGPVHERHFEVVDSADRRTT